MSNKNSTCRTRGRDNSYRDVDNAPSFEKMVSGRTNKPNNQNKQVVETSFHVRRKIDFNQPSATDIEYFLGNVVSKNERYVEHEPRSIKDIGSLGVTYYGDISFQKAIARSKHNRFDRFGKDPKATRDTINQLKGSFMDFLNESRIVQATLEDPLCFDEYDEDALLYGNSDEAKEKAKKWGATSAKIDPTGLLLGGNDAVYVAFDLDSNEFLHEERADIREFFNTQYGLILEDVEHERISQSVPHKMHATFVKIALNDLVRYNVGIPDIPKSFPLLPVDFEARSKTN